MKRSIRIATAGQARPAFHAALAAVMFGAATSSDRHLPPGATLIPSVTTYVVVLD